MKDQLKINVDLLAKGYKFNLENLRIQDCYMIRSMLSIKAFAKKKGPFSEWSLTF